MLLRRLELENVRLFKGNHSLDLTPVNGSSTHQPIVLIGGKNGAGKTTLFESILLCLYGATFNGRRMSAAKYEQYIRQMVSGRSQEGLAAHAFVEIEFEFSHLGRKDVYTVRRYWQIGEKVTEQFTIKRDGTRLTEIEADQWQEFLNEMIPPRFARLFLFDGEKIQTLVDQDSTNLYLKDSFKSLLGLDLVERLKADLSIYISQQNRSSGTDAVRRELEEAREELRNREGELEIRQLDEAALNNRHGQVNAAIEHEEALIAQEGGSYARKREEMKAEKSRLDGEIASMENAIREMAAGLLPFAVTPRYCAQLRDRLESEHETLAVRQSEGVIRAKLEGFSADLKTSPVWDDVAVVGELREDAAARIVALLTARLLDGANNTQELIHNLSEPDHQRMTRWLDQAVTEVPQRLEALTDRLERQVGERRRVTEMINRAPPDEAIAPMIQHLNELHQQLGQVMEQQKSMETAIRSLEFQKNETERRIIRLEERLAHDDRGSRKVSLAAQSQRALDDYMAELQQEKLGQLRETLLTCFTRLLRKEDYITDLRIAPEDYAITLIDRDGNAIPKEQLSAGEKEIFAIAMLWALTLTSGRQLPFIIDTPLGRLDSDHRGNLVMDFFQNAGDQMIIFSTDTEIDREYFTTLSPFIARAYHLDYSHRTKETQITPGYFWRLEEAAQ